jgi:hypothetical protein
LRNFQIVAEAKGTRLFEFLSVFLVAPHPIGRLSDVSIDESLPHVLVDAADIFTMCRQLAERRQPLYFPALFRVVKPARITGD